MMYSPHPRVRKHQSWRGAEGSRWSHRNVKPVPLLEPFDTSIRLSLVRKIRAGKQGRRLLRLFYDSLPQRPVSGFGALTLHQRGMVT